MIYQKKINNLIYIQEIDKEITKINKESHINIKVEK
jgi:hypothetical protein